MKLKVCTGCGDAKPCTTDFFHKHPPSADGLKPRCKVCRRKESRDRYIAKGEYIRQYVLAWQRDNRERATKKSREWAQRNPERVAMSRRRSIARDPVRRAALRAEAERKRLQRDPSFRLSKLIAKQLRNSLREGKSGRRWESIVGYSVDDLREHLERQFVRGMSWSKFLNGEIHIDHIRPRCIFSIQTPDDAAVRECWALSNLRPMWARDNLRKGGKRLFLI